MRNGPARTPTINADFPPPQWRWLNGSVKLDSVSVLSDGGSVERLLAQRAGLFWSSAATSPAISAQRNGNGELILSRNDDWRAVASNYSIEGNWFDQ